MSRTGTTRTYGKPQRRNKAERLFAELLQAPLRTPTITTIPSDPVKAITEQLSLVEFEEQPNKKQETDRKTVQTVSVATDDEPPEVVKQPKDDEINEDVEDVLPLVTEAALPLLTKKKPKSQRRPRQKPMQVVPVITDEPPEVVEQPKEDKAEDGAENAVPLATEAALPIATEDALPPVAEDKPKVQRRSRQKAIRVASVVTDDEPAEIVEQSKAHQTKEDIRDALPLTVGDESLLAAEDPFLLVTDDSLLFANEDSLLLGTECSLLLATKNTTTHAIEEPLPLAIGHEEPVEEQAHNESVLPAAQTPEDGSPRILTWAEVCPPGDKIEKIAEASCAEVYRLTNNRGTSIIKVIRLHSAIKPQTAAQIRAGFVDELSHCEDDIRGELQISEWLADIPGFVVYKERYVVQGEATKGLLETHQRFQKKMKRKDPGRAQFYPSPSRYLDETKFLVVELGDAGVALEDWHLTSDTHLWDIFFLEAAALAWAEDLARFEHRDLHEGNICIRQTGPPQQPDATADGFFGYSGLDITILDYGLSRAEELSIDDAKPIAFDLEKDLSLFTSTHAGQCNVYRQMRSFMLNGDRKCLPPEEHKTPYASGIDGPISWEAYTPYTNVLWLAYLYRYLVDNFKGDKQELARFQEETKEMWSYLDPEAEDSVPCFGSAADVVCFGVEAGWAREEQLLGGAALTLEREDSIILSKDEGADERPAWRSPVRRQR